MKGFGEKAKLTRFPVISSYSGIQLLRPSNVDKCLCLPPNDDRVLREARNRLGGSRLKDKLATPMVVYEGVMAFGPLTIDELYPRIGLSRSATYRAMKHLETGGWVRKLVDRHNFIATARIDELVAQATISPLELDVVLSVLGKITADSRFHWDIGFYVNRCDFCVFESTERTKPLSKTRYPYEHCGALVACCHFSGKSTRKMLFGKKFLPDATDRAKMQSLIGYCRDMLRTQNYAHFPEDCSAAVGLKFEDDYIGSIAIRRKIMVKSDLDLIATVKTVCKIMEDHGFLAKLT